MRSILLGLVTLTTLPALAVDLRCWDSSDREILTSTLGETWADERGYSVDAFRVSLAELTPQRPEPLQLNEFDRVEAFVLEDTLLLTCTLERDIEPDYIGEFAYLALPSFLDEAGQLRMNEVLEGSLDYETDTTSSQPVFCRVSE